MIGWASSIPQKSTGAAHRCPLPAISAVSTAEARTTGPSTQSRM